ncbi:MAG: YqgE/AlgH family protein [Kiloniellales bacterium]
MPGHLDRPAGTPSRRRALRLLAGGALLVPLGAGRVDAARDASFAGQLLVARPRMRDPRFTETVIYMLRHGRGGAMGLVINRLAGLRPLAEVLRWMGIEETNATGHIRVHWGGPVGLDRGLVVHDSDYRRAATRQVSDGVAVTAEPEVLRDIAAGTGPRRHLFALGYAGWAAGQLEAEMAEDAWVLVPADAALLFDEDVSSKWRRALDRWGIDL